MSDGAIETHARTERDGTLRLNLATGLSDAEVAVEIRIRPVVSKTQVDGNGWPVGFFEKVAGSMPDLERPPQGDFEERSPLA